MASLPEPPRESLEQLLARVLDRLESTDVAPSEQAELTHELARLRDEMAATRRPSVVERLRTLGSAAEVEIDLPHEAKPASSPSSELIERLAVQAPGESRYRIDGEIARGGMGSVLKVFDPDLRRTLAMKVALEVEGRSNKQRERTARFLEEAQITGQLDHPGIVPVHELGLGSRGRLYFTMRLVRGRDLGEIYRLASQGAEGWSTTRVLGVLLKACEALAYAHSKGVIHRDLKPTNVMVGRFGEVYVMDWGLAKIVGRKDRRDLRIAREDQSASSHLDLVRVAEQSIDPSTSLVTRDGTVLGTPAYMSPEQARGEIDSMDARSDVYSLGAMLYHLLADAPPYREASSELDAHQMWLRILNGPPAAIATISPTTPPELVAICERAMAPAAEDRYPGVLELAEDLRAFLENRVVHAYETGALAEFKKWVRRNRFAAASTAALLLALIGGSIGFALQQQRARKELQLASDKFVADSLVAQSEEVSRFDPALDAVREQWLADANDLLSRESLHLQGTALDGVAASSSRSLERQRMLHFQGALERLRGEHGLVRAIEDHQRAMLAIEEGSLGEQVLSTRWNAAIESIADRAQYPRYDGLVLEPQFGLLPLGSDPASGLWEFAHLPSGTPPERDASTQALKLDASSSIVLVLVPAGFGELPPPKPPPGSPPPSSASGNRTLAVGPCFLSKYEMTQAQWQRATGENPSRFQRDTFPRERPVERPDLHPVEMVSAEDCVAVLQRLGMRLPTDAEWARACGPEPTPSNSPRHDPSQREPLPTHRPVDTLLPNELGFHGFGGNVGEWCVAVPPADAPSTPESAFVVRDRPRDPETGRDRPRDPRDRPREPDNAGFDQGGLSLARERSAAIGVRPARPLDP